MARRLTIPRTFGVALALMAAMAVPVVGQTPASQQPPKQVDDLSLEDLLNTKISVSSTKGETILESSSAVTIIDRRMIEQFSFHTVGEVLQAVAGITNMRSYMLQGMITSRGILQDLYANKNLLLINNVPSWHAVTGENRAERLSINDIERIEILKGPASVLYGSQAYTSAINIVTRTAKPGTQSFDGYVTGGLGSQYGVGGSYRMATTKDLQLFVGVNLNNGQQIDYNFLDENGVNGTVTDYSNASSGTVNVKFKGNSFLFNAYDVEMGSFGSAPGFKAGASTPQLATGWLTSYQFDQTFKEKLSVVARAFYDKSYREFYRDATGSVYSPIDGYRTGGTARFNYTASKQVNVEAGTDYEFRNATEATSRNRETGALVDGFTDQHSGETSVFTQVDWKPGSWRFIAGTRYTDNSIFGGNLSSRGTVGYKVNAANAVKFIAGQSYRSPSMFEVYTATPNITGNPALKPETSDSFELVYQYASGGFYAQALGYHAIYHDKIYRQKGVPPAGVPNPKAPAFYANGSDFSATGTEFEVKYTSLKKGSYFMNLDVVSGTKGDLVVEQPNNYQHYNFRYVPKYNLSGGASKQFGHFGMSSILEHTGATDGPFGPVSAWTDVQFNVFFEQPFKNGSTIRHTLSWRDAFDSWIAFPEYSRRKANVNDVPMGAAPGFFYNMTIRY